MVGLRPTPWAQARGPMGPCGAHMGAIWTHLDQTCCGVPPLLKVLLTVLFELSGQSQTPKCPASN